MLDETRVVSVGSGFILVGVMTGAFFCYRIFQAAGSTRWPFVPGELESDDLREVVYRGREFDGTADQASASVVDFRYRYSVAGKQYRGTRVTFSDSVNKTTGALRRLQEEYRAKSPARVNYNSNNPAQSLLLSGPCIFNYPPLVTCALFIAAGVFIRVYDFSRGRRVTLSSNRAVNPTFREYGSSILSPAIVQSKRLLAVHETYPPDQGSIIRR